MDRFSVTELAAKKTPQADRDVAGLSPLALQLLVAGSQHPDSRPNTLHSQNVDCAPELRELEERGFIRWIGRDPVVTPKGRQAIDAPSEEKVRLASYRDAHPWIEKLKAENGGTIPRPKGSDHISDDDYKIYRTMNVVAVPIVRMQEELTVYNSVYASRDGSTRKGFFIAPARMIDQPESRGKLVLTLLPKWFCRKPSKKKPDLNLLGVTPDLVGDDWTDDDCKKWASLITRANSINTRIKNGGTRQRARRRFAETT